MQLRFEGGLTSEMVYQQAKVEYASTAALIPDLERKIKIMENGILPVSYTHLAPILKKARRFS